MLKEIAKLVFVAVLGLLGLTYLTADEPVKQEITKEIATINKDSLPSSYKLVGQEKEVTKDELFKPNSKTLVIVGNHDSLSVVKELKNYYDINTPYVMVANISTAPWFVKKMFIPGKLEEMIEGNKTPLIYDFDGDMVKALKVTDNSKTVFIAYIIDEENMIKEIYKGQVKEGALDGSMNTEEKKDMLKPIVDILITK